MPKANKGWNIFSDGLLKFQRGILVLSSASVVLLMTVSVFLRYVLRTDLFGIEDFLVIGAFWLYFIGASYGSYDESHIKADILSLYLKGTKLQVIINFISSLITLIVSIVFTKWAVDLFIWGIVMKGKSPAWGIPYYVPQSSLMVGFILMSFYFVIYLIRDTKNLKNIFTKK